MKEKVNSLERTVSEMAIKLINFENELKEIKKDKINKEQIDNKVQNSEKIKDDSEDSALKDYNHKKVLFIYFKIDQPVRILSQGRLELFRETGLATTATV